MSSEYKEGLSKLIASMQTAQRSFQRLSREQVLLNMHGPADCNAFAATVLGDFIRLAAEYRAVGLAEEMRMAALRKVL